LGEGGGEGVVFAAFLASKELEQVQRWHHQKLLTKEGKLGRLPLSVICCHIVQENMAASLATELPQAAEGAVGAGK
jgi:hypothetical protein